MRGWRVRSPRFSSWPFRVTSRSSPPRGTGLLPSQGNPDVPDSRPPGAPTSPGGPGPTPQLSPDRPHSPSSSVPASSLSGAAPSPRGRQPPRPVQVAPGRTVSAPLPPRQSSRWVGPVSHHTSSTGLKTLTAGPASSRDLRGPFRRGPVQCLGPSPPPGEVLALCAPTAPHLRPAPCRPPKSDQTLQAGPGAPKDPEGNTQAHLGLEGGFSVWCAMQPVAEL
ncbi:hypothetical protein NDU88_000549 [Pleurodeles waltl]|uniref:Uncharacterized protein n=1 Tax=Pleurodeles waltl TaxID=8319 RepID=A0AAV7UQU3_PLEWA|nr:hypothetical protein NDU88_000549 [Pleurodeles waltl]